ncbi:hypothetical protein HUK80_06430 [Flavobacterium sp. MAH-1]|uniref:Uncharacterized protein n=1 Tax=Flavobacterium agri TaxID=2743471 RepID=A0A7Y8Y3D3_9FLAO|nr:hypothetical protein [Flavobacterium agri]NUY80525.1 hypothetical protein [Flavobacterium agri]NYA70550.1 hypothetical protein [Flavobacterium agri]
MKKLILLITIIFCASCKKEKLQEKDEVKTPPKRIEHHPKKIGDYMSDDKDFPWIAKQSDTASYLTRIIFQKEFLVYQFHGQCYYWFFTNHYRTGADKIELLWTYKNDCLLDTKFLNTSYGLHHPKNGDSFCEYNLINDSVIKVKYKFPEWVMKVNETERDSIFPSYLYLEKHDSI